MVGRSLKTGAMLLVISLLVMTDLAIFSYGRRVAELDVVGLVDSGGRTSPPAYLSKQASSSISGRRLGECCKNMVVVSKRLVPERPNPLHN
ncbi:hypothetical protein HU200_049668 [Digitaria exilis]|uniref:Uncharacterized protein n=1 Tax=Digitaria exilis TaxID=1010633 RepID=A0A835EB52_9POAL|nr:hypothetical protein HU200_049668 [Digitaria exilis]